MILIKAQTLLYWNFVDSTEVSIDKSVTCLVGKNESGKTAFLRALYQLNPAYKNHLKPDITNDYPRWRTARDRREANLEKTTLARGVFILDDDDYQELNKVADSILNFPIPRDIEIIIERNYSGECLVSFSVDQQKVIRLLVESNSIPDLIKNKIESCQSFEGARTILDISKAEFSTENKSVLRSIKFLVDQIDKATAFFLGALSDDIKNLLLVKLPKFFYFSNYSMLKGRIDLNDLLSKGTTPLQEYERTALSLLNLANASGKEFQADDFEYRMSELESAANLITQEIFRYWTTNEDLVVRLEHDSQVVQEGNGPKIAHKFIDIRLNDLRHQVTTNFERRSSGFQWFFSFIAAFSEFENSAGNIIVLLDEPGLNLHARAQHDFLRFINERLAKKCQVIYTTHSPFLVEPGFLNRVRLVEDLTTRNNPETGACVSNDILSVKGDTLFPLQAALGYDLAQNLFIGQHNLIVEGPSDYIYLVSFSEYLGSIGRTMLDERWSIVPVGGADKVPTFVALLGNHLDVSILLDSTGKGNQRLLDLVSRGILDQNRILTIDAVKESGKADIEDLFEPSEYLNLFNSAFKTNFLEIDLIGNDPILRRLERRFGHTFPHTNPATELLKEKITFFQNISLETLDRFEALIKLINNSMSL